MPIDAEISSVVSHWQALPRAYGALYFPWLLVKGLSPTEGGSVELEKRDDGVLVPPCGHMAGIYARTDARVGVHKAPANEVMEGAVDLDADISDREHARLNDVGVNCLRALPGRGIRILGARTLSGQPGRRYVNVRRLFLSMSRWIEHNMNDLVFEPNAPSLWERIRQRLGAYCYDLFLQGAIKGRSADEAFFVKCDAEINTPEIRESGRVIADVGLATVVPAEFVIVRITQSVAGIAVGEPTVS
ncbi:MAG: phage tail sheath subtilisin-like domain-containing protein [Pseudomonadota bacterium]